MRLTIGLLLCMLGPEDACLPRSEWLEALIPPRPAMAEMPLWVLNYWPYEDEEGEWVLMDGWNGQCNVSCAAFSNGVRTQLDWQDRSAACISDWVGVWPHDTAVVHIEGYGSFICNDEFGDLEFTEPLYSERFGMWVIPIDRFSPSWSSDLVYNWNLSSRPVTESPPLALALEP